MMKRLLRKRTARKRHKCAQCDDAIMPAQTYYEDTCTWQNGFGGVDGEGWPWEKKDRFHIGCAELRFGEFDVVGTE